MKTSVIIPLLLSATTVVSQTKYQDDFLDFWNIVNDNFVYMEKQGIEWNKVKTIYYPAAADINTDQDFVRFMEKVTHEFYNGHISLNINLNTSNKLIPSGADLYIQRIQDKFFVTDIRKNSGAELSGLRPGMEVIKFNNAPIQEQLEQFLPKYTSHYNEKMIQYALSMLFAGTHDKPRKITVLDSGSQKEFFPDSFKVPSGDQRLEFKLLNRKTGYIKINNSLGNDDLINDFDIAVESLMNTKTLIIDLTETPGGGNTTVARAIMGRFVTKKLAYQQHEIDEKKYETKRYWIEYVVPRKSTYKGRIFVIVGHWTGSMGEGMALGFDRMKRATLIGTRMAGLIGAISQFEMTQTKIRFQIPTEQLYHINGTPREDFYPEKLSSDIYQTWTFLNKKLGNIVP